MYLIYYCKPYNRSCQFDNKCVLFTTEKHITDTLGALLCFKFSI